MSFSSIGDLANSFLLNRQGNAVRAAMNQLSSELVTGLTTDTKAAIRGDYAALADWEARISKAEVRGKTLAEHKTRATVKQDLLAATSADLSGLAADIETVRASNQRQGFARISAMATGALEDFVNRLNTSVAGQSLFSGIATSTAPMQSADDILASAKAAISGETTLAGVQMALNAWLSDATSGYSATAYSGSQEDAQNVRLNEATVISIPGRGDSAEIKSAMRGVLMTALASDSDLRFNDQMQSQILTSAADALRSADGNLIELQARIGHAAARIENAQVEAASEITAARQMRLDALAIDPYETATRLQNAELQLEKIYALTARSARMSLMEYLR